MDSENLGRKGEQKRDDQWEALFPTKDDYEAWLNMDDDGEDYEDEDGYEEGYDSEDDNTEDGDYEDDERLEVKESELKITKIDLPRKILEKYEFLNEMPDGVAVMGGVARSVAREIITGESEPIRDIDLVNIVDREGNSKIDSETADELSREYMPDDYSFGHGMAYETIEDYFSTRDFTINQALILNKQLIVSDVAYNDFQENIIRPTYYEMPYEDDELSSRLFLKALMLRSVISQISRSVPLLEDVNVPEDFIGDFDIALFLNKAMSRGAETARVFVEDLEEWGAIDEGYYGPMELAKNLRYQLGFFEFRPSTDQRFIDVQECEDMNGFFLPEAMKGYRATDRAVQEAMEEYEDELSSDNDYRKSQVYDNNGERIAGYYTQDEYDWINEG